MGSVNLDNTGSGSAITLSSDGASLLLNGTAVSGDTLKAIAKDISDTAVDVFIYDTRKDSDGGAWRKRTQHTSWYNETLNTATRGARKEFPAVAVIVAESDTVTIYDGDDSDMPMWMVANRNSGSWSWIGWSSDSSLTSVFMLNGILVTGSDGSNTTGRGSAMADFIKDDVTFIRITARRTLLTIADRNTGISDTFPAALPDIRMQQQGSASGGSVTSIAMKVLPDAPIDNITGLSVPSIVIGTKQGCNIIQNSGDMTYIDNDNDGASRIYHEVNLVTFANNGAFYMGLGPINTISYVLKFNTLPTVTTVVFTSTVNSLGYYYASPVNFDAIYSNQYYSQNSSSSNWFDLKLHSSTGVLGSPSLVANNTFAGGALTGISTINESSDMVAYTTSTYNTGWLPDKHVLSSLSDTNSGNLVANATEVSPNVGNPFVNTTDIEDLYAQPEAASYVSAGYVTTSTITLVSNNIEIVPSGSGSGAAVRFDVVAGKNYTINVKGYSVNATAGHQTVTTFSSPYLSQIGSTDANMTTNKFSSSSSDISLNVKASGTGSAFIGLNAALIDGTGAGVNTGQKLVIEKISIIQKDDLVENHTGLEWDNIPVNGTITRTPVATGADLVAYSGFSSTNYLEQPYNSDLDFGTGDFSVMGWVKPNSISGSDIVLNRNNFGVSGFEVYINNSVGLGLSTAGQYFQQGSALKDNTWSFFCIKRTNTKAYMYINGAQVNSVNNGANLSVNFPLIIGNDVSKNNPFSGSLTLIRISATAPSDEQIKKIYEDEKHLFQENAKATLYGSSDAVTALAYDDDTELLHAGTSAGRSVFQGLRRIDNTTDAVGAAISASNGMVAED